MPENVSSEENIMLNSITAKIKKGKFIDRPNRFLARVDIGSKVVESFVPNPGRMLEFMIPGKTVFLRENHALHRKTVYDMIGVLHNGLKVSIDSNLPNRFLKALLEKHAFPYFSKYSKIFAEPSYDKGRFDFQLENNDEVTLIEVKSCTLVENGKALFPDAPTVRGARHMRHLAQELARGVATKAAVVFVIQRPDATSFSPHDGNNPDFGNALRAAHGAGVEVIPITTDVIGWTLRLENVFLSISVQCIFESFIHALRRPLVYYRVKHSEQIRSK
jgi:sugar fermentation stimulation protein A